MNFIDTTIFTFVLVSSILIFLLLRDLFHHQTITEKIKNTSRKISTILRHKRYPFFGKKEIIAKILLSLLCLGICTALYARFIEPYWLKTTIVRYDFPQITEPIKIIWLADLQIGNHKKTDWLEKIIKKIDEQNPDLIILGGDIIDNEGGNNDEIKYLDALKNLSEKYPIYYIMGNHEYGIGGSDQQQQKNADMSKEIQDEMASLNILLLANNLVCPLIKQQKICFYGIDDIWKTKPTFSALDNWDEQLPLIFLTHNPDGILSYPEDKKQPSLTLAGHTHGGQVWLPFIGPLGNASIKLGEVYYRGQQNYHGTPIYISVGAGESGGTIRFLARPELTVVEVE
jgi:hypothetical protein